MTVAHDCACIDAHIVTAPAVAAAASSGEYAEGEHFNKRLQCSLLAHPSTHALRQGLAGARCRNCWFRSRARL